MRDNLAVGKEIGSGKWWS